MAMSFIGIGALFPSLRSGARMRTRASPSGIRQAVSCAPSCTERIPVQEQDGIRSVLSVSGGADARSFCPPGAANQSPGADRPRNRFMEENGTGSERRVEQRDKAKIGITAINSSAQSGAWRSTVSPIVTGPATASPNDMPSCSALSCRAFQIASSSRAALSTSAPVRSLTDPS